MARRSEIRIWLLSLLICIVGVLVTFTYCDVRLAQFVYPFLGPRAFLAASLGSAVLLSLEAVVFIYLGLFRLIRGHVSRFGEAVALGCVSSLCAYAVNSSVLKVLFGVASPIDVLQGARHVFHFFAGTPLSSFPSGHMVLAGAFAGVIMKLYRVSIWPLSLLLLCAATLLILGDWHFVSDVIAGLFIGVSAGLLAGELWLAHISRSAPEQP